MRASHLGSFLGHEEMGERLMQRAFHTFHDVYLLPDYPVRLKSFESGLVNSFS